MEVVDADDAWAVAPGLPRQAKATTARANAESTRVGAPLGEYVFTINSSTFAAPGMSSERDGVSSASLGKLLVLTALGNIFHGIEERLGVFGAMDPPLEHIVPCDEWIEIMSFGLLFEQSF